MLMIEFTQKMDIGFIKVSASGTQDYSYRFAKENREIIRSIKIWLGVLLIFQIRELLLEWIITC